MRVKVGITDHNRTITDGKESRTKVHREIEVEALPGHTDNEGFLCACNRVLLQTTGSIRDFEGIFHGFDDCTDKWEV